MKLSKKNAARQSAISKALASGKGLGGLLFGLATSVVGGCIERSPSTTMGDYPAQQQPKNTASETRDASVMGRMILKEDRKEDKSPQNTTNAVNEIESDAVEGAIEISDDEFLHGWAGELLHPEEMAICRRVDDSITLHSFALVAFQQVVYFAERAGLWRLRADVRPFALA